MTRPRAREAGIWFGDLPTGIRNMITDVPGVRVGHCTLVRGNGVLRPGIGPVRTGVTVILPHMGSTYEKPVKGSFFDYNGCGGLHGSPQIREFGMIESPIGLTNTMSLGAVSEGIIKYMLRQNPEIGVAGDTTIPIVAECDDSYLNDAKGLHVREEHVFEAIADASEIVKEGAVGAGTGMSCYDFKGGIGTSSRSVSTPQGKYTLGSLVLSNHGERSELRIDGVPVGRALAQPAEKRVEQGSLVMIVGTDAPVDSRQLNRIARRAVLGMAVTGTCSHNGSGDIVVAFSTANQHERFTHEGLVTENLLMDKDLDIFFRATVDSVEESIVNSIFKAETVTGRDDHLVEALPIDTTLEIMRKHGRLRT